MEIFQPPHVRNEMEETVDQVQITSRWIGVYKARKERWENQYNPNFSR
jgi:hypothetical protein